MERPKINPPLTTLEIMLEGLAAVFVVWMIASLIKDYPSLPQEVPTHFNAAGQPDAWGGKSTILILPLVTIVFYVGLTVLNRFPYIFNYPVEITAENAERQYRLAKTLVTMLKTVITGAFLFIHIRTMDVAQAKATGLGLSFIFLILGGTFIPIIIYMILALKNK